MPAEKYEVSKYRWVIVGVFALAFCTMALACFSVAPLVSSLSRDWGVSFSQANLVLIVLFGLFSGLISLPGGIATDKFGWRRVFCFAQTLLAVSALLRASTRIWPLFALFNVTGSIGLGLATSVIGAMVLKWFPRREVGVANAIANVGLAIGMAIGNAIIFPLLNAFGWSGMFLTLGLIASVGAALSWIFLRENPPYPPEPLPPMVKVGLWESVKQVMNLDNIILLPFSLALVGYLGIVPAVFPVQFSSYGVALTTVGLLLSVMSLVGIPASLIVPAWAFRIGRPKFVMSVGAVVLVLAFLSVFFLPLGPQNIWLAFLIIIIMGCAMNSLMPIRMGLAQLQPGVRPWNAGVLMGIVMTANGLGYFILPSISGLLVERSGPTSSALMLAGVTLATLLLVVLFVKEPKLGPSAVPTTEPEPAS